MFHGMTFIKAKRMQSMLDGANTPKCGLTAQQGFLS